MAGGTGEADAGVPAIEEDPAALVPDPISPTTEALLRTPAWCLGIGAVAGACGGFAFLITGELAGAAVLAAIAGAVLGIVFAAVPAVGVTLVVTVAARRARTTRGFRRWLLLALGAFGALIPAMGFWVDRAFAVDPADGVYMRTDTALMTGIIVTLVVAELLLIPMWRSLRTIRDDDTEPDGWGPSGGQAPMTGGLGNPAASQSAT